jgi:succinate dehydrogenase/fumarate reductase flavoprotein subunit
MAKLNIVPVETDVLIIGGGLAGCMASIKAAEREGLRVTLAEKSNTLASGCAGSGIDHCWSYIPPVHEKVGYTLEDMAEDHRLGMGLGFCRKDLFYLVAGTMYERMLDLEKFGINFRYEDSKVPGKFRIVDQFHSFPSTFNFDGEPIKRKLTAEAKRRGVQIINRVQMTDLITTDGQVSGAVGVNTRTGDVYSFKTKAAVLCCGRSHRLTRHINGIDFDTRMPPPLTGDGTSMAIRAGLPIINIEFLSSRSLAIQASKKTYGDPRGTTQPAARIIDGEGNVLVERTQFYDWENLGKEKWTTETRRKWLEQRKVVRGGAHQFITERHKEGGGPFYLDFAEATDEEEAYIKWSIRNEGKGTQVMRYYEEEEGLRLKGNALEYGDYGDRELSGYAQRGVWVSKDMETGISHLFAAGDEVGGLPWNGAPGAITQGWHCGAMAAERAEKQKTFLTPSEDLIRARKELCSEILGRERGFYWKEVEIFVQNVVDFYCGKVRSQKLLERGLQRLDSAKNAPMKAENPHELARSLDVKSIIDNAELVFRSSLERKESRPELDFRRADYPEKDDKNWLCFLAIRKENGEFRFSKIPNE